MELEAGANSSSVATMVASVVASVMRTESALDIEWTGHGEEDGEFFLMVQNN